MNATYDKNDLKSVLEYAREEHGRRILREPEELYRVICDIAPGFSAEAEILRKLSELGMLSELEKAADLHNQTVIDRTVMKIRYQLAQKMFINEEKTTFFVDTLANLYKLQIPSLHTLSKPLPPSLIPVLSQKSKLPMICVLFALIIAAIVGVVTVQSQTKPAPIELEPLKWTLSEKGVLTISGNGPMPDYGYKPDFARGIVYTNIPWWNQRDDIVSIVIENGITTIGSNAFRMCNSLITVTIPDNVTSIGYCSFWGCQKLSHVTISDSVTNIGTGAFYNCENLKAISVPISISDEDMKNAFDMKIIRR